MLTIYDIDMTKQEAHRVIRAKFEANAYLQDKRIIDMVIEKGYMELEETLLLYKQRPHVMSLLQAGEPMTEGATRKRLTPDATIDEQFYRD